MPRTKLQPETMEHFEAESLRRINKEIRKAMVEANVGTVRELAKLISVDERTVARKLRSEHPWKLDELFRIVWCLDIGTDGVAKMIRGKPQI